MKIVKTVVLALLVSLSFAAYSQPSEEMMEQMKIMMEEKDPVKSLKLMKKIIKTFDLKQDKDAETIDMLKGSVAMTYLEAGNYKKFDKMISSLQNKFNQTSYMNMAASNLLRNNKDIYKAEKLSKRTLELYYSFKDNPDARPETFAAEDWNRFMTFAYYPYCDTYAAALFAVGKNKEALDYQEKAFEDSPENGQAASVERYAKLLVLDNQADKAYSLLLKMAETGKTTEGMNELLKEIYTKKMAEETNFDKFLSDLQTNVVPALKKEMEEKMIDVEAPDFTLLDISGNKVSLTDYRGKIVVLDFWATWCAPCKASFPAMKKAVEKHSDVVFLFIATQEKQDGALERVKNYITQNNYPFKVIMDEPSENNPKVFKVLESYKVSGIPTKIIIDTKGRQRFVSVGFTTDTELLNEMEAMIQIVKELNR